MDATDNISRVTSLRTRPNLAPIGPRTPSRPTTESQPQSSSSITSRTPSLRIPSPAYSAHASPVLSEPRPLPTVQETLLQVQTPTSPVAEPLPPAYSVFPEPQVPEPLQSPPPPPRIPAPPEMKFEHQPVEWKALPLEAALCRCSLTLSRRDTLINVPR